VGHPAGERRKINAEVAEETRRTQRIGRQESGIEEGSFASLRMTGAAGQETFE
jgi:hypothetical protein